MLLFIHTMQLNSVLQKYNVCNISDIAAFTKHNFQFLDNREYTFLSSFACTVMMEGDFQCDEILYIEHGKAGTRFIHSIMSTRNKVYRTGTLREFSTPVVVPGTNLIVSYDSNCPAITLLCDSLANQRVLHRMSDYFINIIALHVDSNSIHIHVWFVLRACALGCCNFSTFKDTLSMNFTDPYFFTSTPQFCPYILLRCI